MHTNRHSPQLESRSICEAGLGFQTQSSQTGSHEEDAYTPEERKAATNQDAALRDQLNRRTLSIVKDRELVATARANIYLRSQDRWSKLPDAERRQVQVPTRVKEILRSKLGQQIP